MQYRLLVIRHLRLPLSSCLLWFYFLIYQHSIQFSFHKISYTLIMPYFSIFCFCFMSRKENINKITLHVADSTQYIK